MKVSPTAAVNAIPVSQIGQIADQIIAPLRDAMLEMLATFSDSPTPAKTLDLEQTLFARLMVVGRELLEAVYNSLKKTDDDQPPVVSHRENNYRRIPDRKPREVVTRFGKISLSRSRYRRGRKGKLIFPLEIVLGLQQGRNVCKSTLVG